MADQAKQTPLIELLTALPEDVRIGVQDGEDWHAGTTWHPVGRLCREAAAELRRLHDLLGKANALCLIRAQEIERLKAALEQPEQVALERERAAIAKAEGEQT